MEKLNKMAKMIRHRGPDDEGFALFDRKNNYHKLFFGDDTPESVIKSDLIFTPKEKYQYSSEQFTVGLAHRRLSIIDLTASGHQPMCDESGRYWITYNGEIYNFREIRGELKKHGYSFFSNSDTEVIIKAYMEWGKECQNKFNGMWAFVIWDKVSKSFWISRDRFGVKPLYYMIHDDFFIVCSEIKCILTLLPLYPNHMEMYSYLLDGPSEANKYTFFDQVYRFPSGHSSTYFVHERPVELSFDKYWEQELPSQGKSFSEMRLKEYADEYYYLLKDSVKLRLYADVNVSCALSGGLDSSSIVYLASNILKEQNNDSAFLSTVSNVYNNKEDQRYDESVYIDIVSNNLNIKNVKSEPDPCNLLEKSKYGLWCFESCYDFVPLQLHSTFGLCKENNFKVNLDGQGGDEILAGYNRYWRNYFASHSFSKDYYLSLLFAPLAFKQKLRAIVLRDPTANPGSILGDSFGIKVDEDYRAERVTKDNYVGISVNETLRTSLNYNLKNHLKDMDSFPMAYSVESRQPFMDYRLISFLNKVPSCYKLRKGWTKYLARIAFENKLPHRINWRKDKLGWSQPIRKWLSGEMGMVVCDVIKKSSFLSSILPDGFKEKITLLQRDHHRPLLRLFNLALHYDLFFSGDKEEYLQ